MEKAARGMLLIVATALILLLIANVGLYMLAALGK